ncbi:MAG: site-specific integrase [Paludibacter sp.]|jgi:site-specific recombinase XerD|nr:site-specific integrase [Paludibacter sp.]
MKTTFNVLFFLKRDKQKQNGTVPLMCRITIDGIETRFTMKTDIDPGHWDVKLGKMSGRSAKALEINALIDNTKSVLNRIYHQELERMQSVTAEKVKNIFLGINTKQHTLLELFKKHNADVKSLIGISKSKATYQKYEVTLKHTTSFLRKRYNLSDIHFAEINHMFISDFETFLMVDCQCQSNTTAKFMQFFKRIILIARNNGWMLHDPFVNYKIRINKVDRGYLTKEELELIFKKKIEIPRLEHVRDIFVFSCFTGLAYIDVYNLKESNIRTSFDGNLWIMTKRQKTDVNSNIPLLEVPKMILAKYKGKLPEGKILPITSNQKMNAYLKEIGDLCEIKKNLTFHLARHTFATTITLSQGVPIETVSKMLGHTNIKTTQIYARITDNKIGHDMGILSDKLKEMESAFQL